jgi:hypothetical protein
MRFPTTAPGAALAQPGPVTTLPATTVPVSLMSGAATISAATISATTMSGTPLSMAALSADALPATAPVPQGGPMRWREGQAVKQGYFGAAFLEIERSGGNLAPLIDDDFSSPTLGGGAQVKLSGKKIDFGIEGLLALSWRGDVAAFASTGGGAAIAVDVDLLVWDLYGGPFVSMFLGDRTRIYASAGPLIRWGWYDQDGPTAFTSGDGSGFGWGYYARTGIEFGVARNMMIGVAARWTDTEIDLSGGFGDLEVRGVEALVTVTHGF